MRPRLFRFLLPPALAALLAAASGCGPASSAASAPAGHRGGTLVVGWSAEPMGVNELLFPPNYLSDELLRQLFVQLVQEQGDFERHPTTVAPGLATSFDWSADHKALTFHLRDARWSDGEPITAEDVRWTWQLEKRPEFAAAENNKKRWITAVDVIDPHTVRFHFDHVYATQLLDANEGSILPKHAWEKLPLDQWGSGADWFKQHLVVSGPYRLASWKPQQELVLERNERYFKPGRPYIDRIVIRIVSNQNNLLTQLQTGEVDLVQNLSPQDAKKVRANPRLAVVPFWFRTWVGVLWNTSRPLFADPEVRRALTLAIDRQGLVDAIWQGYAEVSDSPILNHVWAHDPTLRPWPYQPEEARRLLAGRGWKAGPAGILEHGGRPFSFEIFANTGNQQRIDAAVTIQAQLARIGVQAQVRQLEFNTMSDLLDKGTFDACVLGFTMDTGLDLTSQFHTSGIGSNNLARYSNPEVDRLLDDAQRQPDLAHALPDLLRIQRILHREQPATFLWESQRVNVHNRRLHDVRSNILYSLFQLEEWWLDPAPPGAGHP
jgi:peptide/nickel transport system substrate-binding protein